MTPVALKETLTANGQTYLGAKERYSLDVSFAKKLWPARK